MAHAGLGTKLPYPSRQQHLRALLRVAGRSAFVSGRLQPHQCVAQHRHQAGRLRHLQPQVLQQHTQRRPVVERQHHVAVHRRDLVRWPHRCAALRHARGKRHLRPKPHPA